MRPDYLQAEQVYQIFRQNPSVTTDSRNIRQGDMFFALKGDYFNGNKFALEALNNGASYAVIDDISLSHHPRLLLVEDVLKTLQEIAGMHREQMNLIRVIGITGSNGKTTTKELMSAVLETKFHVVATRGNLNNHIGVPLTILRVTPSTEILIVEMGANHPGEIAALCEISKPDSGLITSIGKAHLEGFGSLQGVMNAKQELFLALDNKPEAIIFCNADDPLVMALADPVHCLKVTYGSNPDAGIQGVISGFSRTIQLVWENYSISTHLVGDFNLGNVMAAIAVGVTLGVDQKMIVQALSDYKPQNHRSQFQQTAHNELMIDCYNANPTSMEASIKHFLKMTVGKDRLMILGDMFELGADEAEEHRKLILRISPHLVDTLLVGKAFMKADVSKDARVFQDVDQLGIFLKEHKVEGKFILLKGSRGVHLDQVIPLL